MEFTWVGLLVPTHVLFFISKLNYSYILLLCMVDTATMNSCI
nr:MAG TPA: hypothetical protein [Caudoviricetes sp.]